MRGSKGLVKRVPWLHRDKTGGKETAAAIAQGGRVMKGKNVNRYMRVLEKTGV